MALDRSLVFYKLLQADIINGMLVFAYFDLLDDFIFPSLGKRYSRDLAEQVEPVWGKPELNDQVFSGQFLRRCDPGDIASPKSCKAA